MRSVKEPQSHSDLPKGPILIVDDELPVRRFLQAALEEKGYLTAVAENAAQARVRLQDCPPVLMLCDVSMPGESGLSLARDVLNSGHQTAVIMVTGNDDPKVGSLALEFGAYGYLVKPVGRGQLLITIENALRRRKLEGETRQHQSNLEELVLSRTKSLEEALTNLTSAQGDLCQAQEETILRLARAAEFRDDDTAQHVQRMSHYCSFLASGLGWLPERCQLLRLASSLHDIGKIGIPDSILLKPERLGDEERSVMRRHAEDGYRILEGSPAELLKLAAVIAWTHHERFDGSGYPRGLKGKAIPLEGRLTMIADVFDALTNPRPYKAAYSPAHAVDIMKQARGEYFDPDLLDLFFDKLDGILAIRQRYDDAIPGTRDLTGRPQ